MRKYFLCISEKIFYIMAGKFNKLNFNRIKNIYMNNITNSIAHQNLQRVLTKLIETTSDVEVIEEHIKIHMEQRNWGFDYYLRPLLINYFEWLEYSDEFSNFTYELKNIHHLSGWVSCVTGSSNEESVKVIEEIINDKWLINYLKFAEHQSGTVRSAKQFLKTTSGLYGRRLGWYAITRLLKPKLVIETGVDRGLGSTILCRALMRNAEDGSPGRYIGTDINPSAGYLLKAPLTDFGHIEYGDSIISLSKITEEVDLFINDSDHSSDYEEREYLTIEKKLSTRAILLGDNSHVTDKLYKFSCSRGMKFLHFAEQPKEHWYPGAGIGAAF